MKKIFSSQSIILLFAIAIALIITIYVGSASVSPLAFYWNTILVNISFIGDGLFVVGLFFFLLFYFNQKKMAYRFFLITVFTMLFVQVIKNVFSNQSLRLFFEQGSNTSGTENLFFYNFISSHTAIAFTIAVFFSLHFKKTTYTLLFFVVAFFVAYSRVVLVGESLLAIFFGLLPVSFSFVMLKKMNSINFSNKGYFFNGNKIRKMNRQSTLEV
jgi:membrane-associated phospholipid phosphatase